KQPHCCQVCEAIYFFLKRGHEFFADIAWLNFGDWWMIQQHKKNCALPLEQCWVPCQIWTRIIVPHLLDSSLQISELAFLCKGKCGCLSSLFEIRKEILLFEHANHKSQKK